MKNNNKLLNIKYELDKYIFSHLSIIELSIYHSTTITIKLETQNYENYKIIQFINCESFQGSLNEWKNIKLDIDFKNEIKKIGNRSIENYYFLFRNKTNNFYIKSKDINFIDEFTPSALPKVLYAQNDLENLKDCLKRWKEGRVRIVNSNKNFLQVVIDSNTNNRAIKHLTENPDKLYVMDSENSLCIYCYYPTYVCSSFESWEIYDSLVIKENIIFDPNSEFKIVFKAISHSE